MDMLNYDPYLSAVFDANWLLHLGDKQALPTGCTAMMALHYTRTRPLMH